MPLLDAIRGFAVLGVVFTHCSQFAFRNIDGSVINQTLLSVFVSGRFGVELFFLLSGFLISYIYELKEISPGSYFKTRFFRIWPLWMIFTFIWAIVWIWTGDHSVIWAIQGLGLSTFFSLWLSPSHFDTFLAGAWSIQIEIICYLIFWFIRKQKTDLIIALAICVNVLGMASSTLSSVESETILGSIHRLSFQSGFNFFVFGWLGCRLFRKLNKSFKFAEILHSPNKKIIMLFAIWAATFLLTPALFGNQLEAFGFVAGSLVFVLFSTKWNMLSNSLIWFGRYSYSIFFVHFVILFALESIMNKAQFPTGTAGGLLALLLTYIFVLSCSAIFATISMRFLEIPLMKLAHKKKAKSNE